MVCSVTVLACCAGQIVFTNPSATPLTFPEGGAYAITSFRGQVVDAAGRMVPLSEVYEHHFLLMHYGHRNELCTNVNGLNYVRQCRQEVMSL